MRTTTKRALVVLACLALLGWPEALLAETPGETGDWWNLPYPQPFDGASLAREG